MNANRIDTTPPDTWKPPGPQPRKPDKPLTKNQVIAVAIKQVITWKRRAASAPKDEIDALVEAQTMHRLLADQAQLFADLIERIA